jgi:adenine-specific DNA-methyltransferase
VTTADAIVAAASDAADARKTRGAFFTPDEVARFIVEWAVRTPDDRTFEPSCGEAIFMLAVVARLRALGARDRLAGQLHGAELHAPSAVAASDALRAEGAAYSIAIGDFFEFPFAGGYDAVVGNPPYVRYQDFTGEAREKARAAARTAGVSLTALASSWAAFVVRSAQLVKPKGRLGLVLPAELLSVNYAGPVREFLMDRFARVRLVVFDERVFPGVLEEVVLLLSEGQGPTDAIEIGHAANLDGLPRLSFVEWSPPDPNEKWTPALLSGSEFETYAELLDRSSFVELESWGETDLGMVTGNNRYFTLTPSEVRKRKIPHSDLMRISPPGSRHLRGLTFTDEAWRELAEADRRVYLFLPPLDDPAPESVRYIARGRRQKVQQAYKCRVREPKSKWWRVPTVEPPDLFLTYMNHDSPRLVSNEARVSYLNSVHGVTLKPKFRALGAELLPVAALNSLTLLGAELVGRAYGGGLLKVEPKEGDLLPVPAPETIASAAAALREVAPQVGRRLRSGDLLGAAKIVDDVLLVAALGLKRAQVRTLREAREALFSRRAARAGKA